MQLSPECLGCLIANDGPGGSGPPPIGPCLSQVHPQTLAEAELMCPAEYAACLASPEDDCPELFMQALDADDEAAMPTGGSGTYLALIGCMLSQTDTEHELNHCVTELDACWESPTCSTLLMDDSLEMTTCAADPACAMLMMCEMAVRHNDGETPECIVQCRADLTQDHRIGVEDLLLLLSQYGSIC